MNRLFNEIKWTSILYSLILIASGVLLLLFPQQISDVICTVVGVGFIVVGITVIISYLARKAEVVVGGNDFVTGVVFVAIGVFVMVRPEFVISVIPFILGLLVLISGVKNLQSFIDVRRMKYDGGIAALILALITITFGILLIINPFESAMVLMRVIGVGLIVSGGAGLYTTLYLQKKLKNYKKERAKEVLRENDIIDAD